MDASVVCSFCLKPTFGELIEENFVIFGYSIPFPYSNIFHVWSLRNFLTMRPLPDVFC